MSLSQTLLHSFGIVALGVAIGCAPTQTAAPATASQSTENDALIARAKAWFDAFNRHDLAAIEAFYADSAVATDPESTEPRKGPAQIVQTYRALFTMAPNVEDRVINIDSCGKKVFVEFVSTGRIDNVPEGQPEAMRGKTFTLSIFAVLEFENDKIVRDASYYDQVSFMSQVGLM